MLQKIHKTIFFYRFEFIFIISLFWKIYFPVWRKFNLDQVDIGRFCWCLFRKSTETWKLDKNKWYDILWGREIYFCSDIRVDMCRQLFRSWTMCERYEVSIELSGQQILRIFLTLKKNETKIIRIYCRWYFHYTYSYQYDRAFFDPIIYICRKTCIWRFWNTHWNSCRNFKQDTTFEMANNNNLNVLHWNIICPE